MSSLVMDFRKLFVLMSVLVTTRCEDFVTESDAVRYTCFGWEFSVNCGSLTWEDARQACKNDGFDDLATIRSAEMLSDIHKFVDENGWTKANCHGGAMWIGYYDPDTTNAIPHTEADFQWLSTDTCAKYVEWEAGNPNDNTKKNATGQSCTDLWLSKNGLYDDNYCTRKRGYICEKLIRHDCGDDCGCNGSCFA
ncbi:macrophage mannose receptor 1-like [Saccoglossus kowalevskii]|uniref:Uncharacterized protein LOC100375347 n=1 Tax=Saccoglossus kowalevskii TaxID=10224 RepID=A0ABM0LTS4_SACKO|nr:PREDICTED: uncharacterized protein LOC100375347 [Saccoglossus kowalevskii]